MSNIVESKTEIQIDIPLTEEAKLTCSDEMINAMNAISAALSDMKDYQTEKKEDIEKWEGVVSGARSRASEAKSAEARLTCTVEIVEARNAISEIEDDLKSYQTEKKAEIAKFEAIVNVSQAKINRGKDRQWVSVKVLKDFDKRIKTFVDIKTGEVVRKLPMTDEDMQIALAE
jgi:hypothetical protein